MRRPRAGYATARALTLSAGEQVLPIDKMQLYAEGERACEALGDPSSALAYKRLAFEQYELLAGRSARAKRVTIEIQHELELAQRARDEAQRRRQDAEAERARLAELNEALRQANLARTRLLAAASHDLRQPIHALNLQLAHLHTCSLDSEGQAVAERIGRSLGALGTMFDTLLDISRMDAGVVTPRREVLPLRPLLARLVEEFAPLAQAKGLRLGMWLPAAAHTESDPALLETLLRNLMSNALKYTERGGVLLGLRACGRHWRLQVWDTGCGIAPAHQARVFEEFFQVGNPERDRARGLGLGLAIVRRLSQLLDHPLALHSRVARGSCLSLDLPRVAPAAQRAAAADDAPPCAHLCVAVIEDDGEVRDSLAALLRRWGHTVIAGEDEAQVRQAHRAAGAGRVQAVIADYRLRDPARPGDTQAAALRAALGPEAALLVVSGDTAPERLRAFNASGATWLSKPVQPARLRSWLASVATRAEATPR